MRGEARLNTCLREIRACTVCARELPLGPRPVVRGTVSSRLLITSQAPGTRVHETGLSFNDRSGDVLRSWLGIDRETFLLVGSYAIDYYLRERRKRTMTETVRAWREYGPRYFPLPHPSWRNVLWMRQNPWYEAEVLPDLRARVRAALEK